MNRRTVYLKIAVGHLVVSCLLLSANALAHKRSSSASLSCAPVRVPKSDLSDKRSCKDIKSTEPGSSSPTEQDLGISRRVSSVDEGAVENDSNAWQSYAQSDFTNKFITSVLDHIKHARSRARCCLRFLKQDLMDGCFFHRKPGTRYARDFGPELEKAGFKNILAGVEAKGNLAVAPRGAILVYEATDDYGLHHKGLPGHIEVKDDEGSSSYSSFYTSQKGVPRSGSELAFEGKFKGNDRQLIGIYIKPDGQPADESAEESASGD